MFKGVISRDNGNPWGNTGMTSRKWLKIPTATVNIDELIATQPGVLLNALVDTARPIGGDPMPHIIQWRGDLYLEDGHHRAIRALIHGQRTIQARILQLPHETHARL